MSLALPLALFGLLTIPALVAIYWLRNRSRTRTVSSLMLWMDQRQLKEGGLLIQRLQTPLLFFLELLSILLLVFAAAGPIVRAGHGATPLVIVLDDSFSMLAGGTDSPRHSAEASVRNELRGEQYTAMRIVLAGETPQMLGEATGDERQLNELFEQWKCFSSSSNLEEAITFAFAVGGERARALVLTDHPPSEASDSERLEWRAFGRRGGNIAFVNATRSAHDGQDRCMLEIANLSDRPAKTELVVEGSEPSTADSFRELQHSEIELPPNGTKHTMLTLAARAGALRARVGADLLDIDNQVTLLPESERLVRVQVNIRNEQLRELVETAFRSITTATVVSTDPEILLTDEDDLAASPRLWIVRVTASPDAESYVGPFVLDRSHPLTEGLSLEGVVWGASKSAQATGAPVITAGNVPLVTDIEHGDGAREVRIWFRSDLSTLQRTPAWPVMMWNLLSWRASELPGVSQSNLRLGSDARIKLSLRATSVEVMGPAGTSRVITPLERTVSFKPDGPGIYAATVGSEGYSFAVNALRKEESDLRGAGSGQWGSLFDAAGADSEHRNIAWVFLLLLMLVLAAHLALVSRGHVTKTYHS